MTTYNANSNNSNLNEMPKRREKSPEEIARKQAMRKAQAEKRASEIIHRNPKWSPVYKLEEQRAGHLLDLQEALRAEHDSILNSIRTLRHLGDMTVEEMCYQDSAFMGTPIEDECATLKSHLQYALERKFEQIGYWIDAVEDELSKRTGDQDWRRAEARDMDC